MTYETIRYAVADGIATITLNRPGRLNAFTMQMGDEVIDAIDRTDADDAVRAVVFTGAGRAYCAGADLSGGGEIFEPEEPAAFTMESGSDYGGQVSRRLFVSTKPLIAAVNGPAVGIGASSTLPMDVRLASTDARFGFVFTRRGLVPEACSSWFLPRIVGISQAAEWVYSGRIFGADEARETGLVRSVHQPDELLPAAYALARSMSEASSPVAVAVSRRMLWEMLGAPSPVVAHQVDSRGIHALGQSADMREGVASFLEKRPPQFPGRPSCDLPDYFKRWQQAGSVDAFLAGEAQRAGSRPGSR